MAERLATTKTEHNRPGRKKAAAILASCLALAACSGPEVTSKDAGAVTSTSSASSSQPKTYSLIEGTTKRVLDIWNNPPAGAQKNHEGPGGAYDSQSFDKLTGTFPGTTTPWELDIIPGAAKANQISAVTLSIGARRADGTTEQAISIKQYPSDQEDHMGDGTPVVLDIAATESGSAMSLKSRIGQLTGNTVGLTDATFDIEVHEDYNAHKLEKYDPKYDSRSSEEVKANIVLGGMPHFIRLCYGTYNQDMYPAVRDSMDKALDAVHTGQEPLIAPPSHNAQAFVIEPDNNTELCL